MAKISKNIKQLRNERGMTQDELAEKLHVTRQAISSWENDRTQPDVQMLGRLREVFGVTIEELLYGKKRNTTLELEKPDYTKTLITVFSILGGLLVAVGLVLIFVVLWEDVPEFLKKSMSLIPLVLGIAVAYYVYKYKREKIAWCESGAVVSLVGIIAGLYMVADMFELYRYFNDDAFYISVCAVTAAIMFVLRAVSALPILYLTGALWCGFSAEAKVYESFGSVKFLFRLLCLLAVVAVGVCFMQLLKKEKNYAMHYVAAKWIIAVATPVMISFVLMCGGFEAGSLIMFVAVCGLSYYVFAAKEKLFISPFKTIGFFIMTATAFFGGVPWIFVSGNGFDLESRLIMLCVFQVLMLGAALYFNKFKFKSKMQSAMCFSYLFIAVAFQISMILHEKNGRLDVLTMYMREGLLGAMDIAVLVIKIASFVFFGIMIVLGATEKRLFTMNVGFICFILQIMLWLLASELSLLFNGFVLLFFGAVLLTVNLKLTKKQI